MALSDVNAMMASEGMLWRPVMTLMNAPVMLTCAMLMQHVAISLVVICVNVIKDLQAQGLSVKVCLKS